ncbi:MAG: short-chain dehydrogenase [Sulfobacillus benefaciens]|uniref:Short-chain dehydrogenase n=1 Tax=Sulfobacillus benefaciens TaxID=453960 RepID=A0A2T2WV09_9FIRM|nr:MAG: short-chain dehydrogenase [Sulfobacillus benefaciens]
MVRRGGGRHILTLGDKVAVVTGAAGSIGRAGAKIALLDINPEALDGVADSLAGEGLGGRFCTIPTNVGNAESVRESFRTVDRELGSTDVVVANAGVAQGANFIDISLENWQRTLDINLTGVFLTCQEGARRMMTNRHGSIITMSSTNGLLAEKALAAYNASKAGVLLLTKTIAIELAPYGIRANALNPGFIDTGLAARSGLDPEFLNAYVTKIPMGRFGLPAEVADAALFLASDASSFITGIGLVVDGGQISEE